MQQDEGRHENAFVEDKVYIAAGSSNKGGGNMNSIEVFSLDHHLIAGFVIRYILNTGY